MTSSLSVMDKESGTAMCQKLIGAYMSSLLV